MIFKLYLKKAIKEKTLSFNYLKTLKFIVFTYIYKNNEIKLTKFALRAKKNLLINYNKYIIYWVYIYNKKYIYK